MEETDDMEMGVHLTQGGEVTGRKKTCVWKSLELARQNVVMILIMVGICLGFGLGLAVRECNPSEDVIMWIGMPGDLFMRLFKMTLIPLTVCSVIAGAASLDPKTGGKIGVMILVFVILTNVLACCLSVSIVMILKPGARSQTIPTRRLEKAMKTHDVLADLLRNLMPDNIVEAAFRQSVTKYVLDSEESDEVQIVSGNGATPYKTGNRTVGGNNSTVIMPEGTTDLKNAAEHYSRVVTHSNSVNILGLVTISCVFGVAAGKVKEQVPVFLSFFENVLQLVLIVVRWFYWLTPIGVASLIAKAVFSVEDVGETFSDLGLYIVTVIATLMIHLIIILPVLYALIVRKNPIKLLLSMFTPVSIAFAATSSFVAMPEMLHICENKFKMERQITRIGIPIIITLNADGSAAFIVAASVFVTQYSGVEITANIVITILLLTIVTSMAIPALPSASIFIIIIILTANQVPLENVAMLFAVEWLLDRARTGVNAASHMFITAYTNALCKKTVRTMKEANIICEAQNAESKGN